MRIAIPQWQGRIAPVFDVAGHLLLVDVEDGHETHREEQEFLKTDLQARAAELLDCKIDVLICGAISASLQFKIVASGVRVSAFICGGVDDVLTAYLNGTLASRAFAMPGCQRWRWRGGEDVLPAGFGMGRRRGRLRQNRSQIQNIVPGESPAATAACASFTCPKCGEKMQHKTGPNQVRNACPKCGAPIAPF
jgi:predicted Fe-Mo cluster-binding NifX family protein